MVDVYGNAAKVNVWLRREDENTNVARIIWQLLSITERVAVNMDELRDGLIFFNGGHEANLESLNFQLCQVNCEAYSRLSLRGVAFKEYGSFMR